LADGLDAGILGRNGRVAAARLAAAGLLDRDPLGAGRVVLTRRGRLLADAVVRDLVD
jgi:oxygen-independent coproporphyrinogen-3 oxidase